ncbi:hypothetical protein N7533_006239 [Penicillium manginii]|uniref:uncharacterized protein n=1 Tax=Penicillium manginii TaxID=203109 RepID=UPI002546AD56|nr:uncharacterized protein N7533_006239 [Penicillium manginii]KAJ5756696.1 hypothetical protein N7533_006239 [Penicillium manginii]
MPQVESAVYSHGHHASVIRNHSQRTAKNSMAFLLPHLKPSMKILDLGCGPGSITTDLAEYVPEGHVVGLDRAVILDQARELASSRGVTNIEFIDGDANELPFESGTFDVCCCHQLLQHVGNPILVLEEMRRVVKPGGIIAAREADYSVFSWYPESRGLSEWQELYDRVARHNGGEPNAGKFLHVWARKAGLSEIQCSVSNWCFSTDEETRWWSDSWKDRALHSSFATTALEGGLAKMEDLERVSEAWKQWGGGPGCLVVDP